MLELLHVLAEAWMTLYYASTDMDKLSILCGAASSVCMVAERLLYAW